MIKALKIIFNLILGLLQLPFFMIYIAARWISELFLKFAL